MSENKEKRNWAELVSKANGTAVFLPEKFLDRAKEMRRLQAEFKALISQVAEKEIKFRNFVDALMLDVRVDLAAAGNPTWTKDLGFDDDAMKDNEFILNLRENQR